METSQQQRRLDIGEFASALTEAEIEFDVLDLVDTLWLAQFIESEDAERTMPSEVSEPPPLPADDIELGKATDSSAQTEDMVDLFPAERPSQPDADTQPSASVSGEQPQGLPFAVPAAPALRTRLDLTRAMRPLMRKVPSRQRFELDEAATVTQIAETQVWMPVVRPQPERWLELDLVVEEAKTTVIWERSIAELAHLAAYQGAFRAVRTWRLGAKASGEVQLFPRWLAQPLGGVPTSPSAVNQRPRNPRELIDPTGRRLIWMVSDCTTSLWQQAEIYETLRDWSLGQSVSIMQMFPRSLWSRTALRNGYPVSLSALLPGAASANLEVSGLPRRVASRGRGALATVPVVTMEPEKLVQWARVVAGAGDSHTVGRTFDIGFIRQQVEKRQSAPEKAAVPAKTAAQRVAVFRATSSKTVRKLANLMAAVPVSLPVIDLLREEFRGEFEEEVRQSHVAEVLLSGLLRRRDTADESGCSYMFFGDESFGDESSDVSEQVRDILLRDASIKDSRRVLDVLSEAICRKLGRETKSFPALLKETQASEELKAAALPLAHLGVKVLLKLGGEPAKLARRMLQQQATQETEPVPKFPPLVDFAFNQAVFIELPEFPPLLTETFTIRTLERQTEVSATDSLAPFEMTVATLTQVDEQWQIQRRQRSARRFIEPLPEDLTLEMVAIPGGTFTMGSPEDEAARLEYEGPQREVTVPPFLMGRYPVTQAQWRVVAALPQVERELGTGPSNFKGDARPVEGVSWYDAVEFCARLSVHTGREYRLPTEAEWEYACRAGTTTPFHFGDMITTEVANYDGRAYAGGPEGENRRETTPVDHFGLANAFGLSDMHGNVREWCQDHWHDSYEGAPTDGSAWLTDNEKARRVRRGGSWFISPGDCRSAYRYFSNPVYRINFIGFRVSCSAPRALP